MTGDNRNTLGGNHGKHLNGLVYDILEQSLTDKI